MIVCGGDIAHFWPMFKDEMITAGAEKINNTNEECVLPFAIHCTGDF